MLFLFSESLAVSTKRLFCRFLILILIKKIIIIIIEYIEIYRLLCWHFRHVIGDKKGELPPLFIRLHPILEWYFLISLRLCLCWLRCRCTALGLRFERVKLNVVVTTTSLFDVEIYPTVLGVLLDEGNSLINF